MWKIISDNIKIAFESIKSQKIRAGITMMIIAFGIMSLVGTLTVVKGIDNNFSAGLKSLGSNKFGFKRYENNFLQGKRHNRNRKKINPRISYRNAIDFKKRFKDDDALVSISYAAARDIEIKTQDKKSDPKYLIIGVDENYNQVNALDLKQGQNFKSKDIINNKHIAIIGTDLVKELFENENPVHKTIIINGNRFTVTGILTAKQSTFGGSQNNKILIPINLARSIFPKPNSDYSVNVSVKNKSKYDLLVSKAIALMRNIRRLKPTESNNFGINRSDKLEKELKKVSNTLEIFAFIIGLITILGSSIALMNIMLVSVTERTREIGIRKAIGANSILVMLQFFVETLVITFLGGLIGIVFGLSIGFAVAKLMKMPFTMPWNAIGIAIFVIFVVAIISGLYPAYKASRLDPIQALRYE
jgi:putative ABC transport system permease protein